MKIQNHLYVVTGASSGLGQSTAETLVASGAFVALFDLRPPSEPTRDQRTRYFECDVGDPESVHEAFERVNEWHASSHVGGDDKVTWGGVVHCGGVGMVGKTIDRETLDPWSFETFRAVHRVNLDGSYLIASKVASEIVKQRQRRSSDVAKDLSKPDNAVHGDEDGDRGVIILTSSVSATEGQMGQVAYASSKAAVEGLVLPMSRDLARYGIRVVCIAPSLFATNMGKNTSDKTRNSLLATTLFPPRFGVPREFAHLAKTVIENGYLNGTVIRIDGGSRMAKM
ncbi:hypothetical protein JCM3766R1_004517 [Sporobolomyces carnicolor]